MKKFLSLAIIVASLAVAALPASAQFRYGPTVGMDFTSLKFKQNLFDVSQVAGATVGVQGEMMFPGIGFGVDIAALYTMKGAKLNLGQREVWSSDGYGLERSYLHYLEIPVNLRFKWTRMAGLEDYVAPYVYGGPSFGFLLGHNRIDALKYAGGDLGVQCGLGFEILHKYQIQAGYTWGMTYSLKTAKLEDLSARNRAWTVRLTYLF